MIKTEDLVLKKSKVIVNDLNFEKLMLVYTIALEKVKNKLLQLEENMNNESDYNIITNVISRIKKPESIIDKMIKKGYSLTYQSLIQNINDIAGIRIVCISEKDVYKVVKQIIKLKEIKVLKKKNYIKHPKSTGYSAYHIILEVPIYLQSQKVLVKVEVQVRTIEMDFWANLKHGVKYKSNSKI